MKRIKKTTRLFFLLAAVCSLLFLTAYAADPQVEENEFSIATFHSPRNFVSTNQGIDQFYTSVEWLAENAEAYRLQFVGMLGNLTPGSVSAWADYSALGMNAYVDACLREELWNEQWQTLRGIASPLIDNRIPTGVALSFFDYPGGGKLRNNLVESYFLQSEMIPDGYGMGSGFFDQNNFYYCFTAGKTDFMVMTLELWPRNSVINWASDILKKHSQKRVILITAGFLNSNGQMCKMPDWQLQTDLKLSNADFVSQYINSADSSTDIAHGNMIWTDKPRDGDQLWEYFIKKNDNIFYILNSHIRVANAGTYQGELVTNVFQNEAGYDVAVLLANISHTVGGKYGAVPVISEISDDGSQISAYYCSEEGMVGDGKVSFDLSLKEVAESGGNASGQKIRKTSISNNTAYINGYEDHTFRPQNNMTRAEAAAIVFRLLEEEENVKGLYESSFSDVRPEDWFYDEVAYLQKLGVLSRYQEVFLPLQNITRAEFVEMVYLAGGFHEKLTDVFFDDVPESHSFYDAVAASAGAGIVNGYEDGTFRPDNTITRAEVVTIVNRVLGISATADLIAGAQVKQFDDISGHWAYPNIIMASNDKVTPSYYGGIDMNGITQNDTSIILENSYFRYTISRQGGKVTEFYDKLNRKNILVSGAALPFLYLLDRNNAKNPPVSVQLENNRLAFTFADGAKVFLLAQVRDKYMTFEVDSYAYADYYGIVFAQTLLKYELTDDQSFAVVGMSMSYKTDPVYFPDVNNQQVIAKSYFDTGINGSKIAVIAGPQKEIRDTMKTAALEIEKGKANVTVGVGGPWSLDYAENKGDYVIISESDAEIIRSWTDMYLKYGVDQIDFHQGSNTFRQGDFYFYKFEDSAAGFKTQVADPLKEKGIISSLHTYSFYIVPSCAVFTADPKWQKQFEFTEIYTLAESMGKFSAGISTVESTKDAYRLTGSVATSSVYFLIDEEIIRIDLNAIGEKGFAGVQRAQLGTKAETHQIGAKVRRIGSYYGGLCPQIGSELFYEVARLTAKAYNEGGFGMVYFDAMDGITKHTDRPELYTAAFINEFLKYCDTVPMIEHPYVPATTWLSRSRAGAWDHPRRSYKNWNDAHLLFTLQYKNAYLATLLGWYHFYPEMEKDPGNYTTEYHYFDDVDYLGTMAIANDSSMVYQGLTLATLEKYPALARNMERYNLYSKLRKTGYFSETVKAILREKGYEYALVDKGNGVYALAEKHYVVHKVQNASDTALNTIHGVNPFGAQEPFVRIYAGLSSLGNNPITLLQLDENKTLNEQSSLKATLNQIDVSKNLALKVKIYGNASGDAVMIRLKGVRMSEDCPADFVVKLDFEGWKEFILVDADSGDYTDLKFAGDGAHIFTVHRALTEFTKLISVEVLKSGNCQGVKMSSIQMCEHTDNPITNPTLQVGDSTVTFRCTIASTEYLEYFPGSPAVIYDRYGNAREVNDISGSLTVAGGNFNAVFTGEGSGNGPVRAEVTLGFTGAELTN